MASKHKITMRVAELREISSFDLAEGEDLTTRVGAEIAKADQEGRLSQVATSVIPAVLVTEVGEDKNLAGGEEILKSVSYNHLGQPLTGRSVKVQPAGKSGFVAIAVEDESAEEKTIGVFPDEEIAHIVGHFWTSGYLPL